MAITAWSAKVFSSSICESGNGFATSRYTVIVPIGLSVAQHRHGKDASEVGCLGNVLVLVLGIRADVGNVDDAPGKNGATRGAASAWGRGIGVPKRLGSLGIQVAEARRCG